MTPPSVIQELLALAGEDGSPDVVVNVDSAGTSHRTLSPSPDVGVQRDVENIQSCARTSPPSFKENSDLGDIPMLTSALNGIQGINTNLPRRKPSMARRRCAGMTLPRSHLPMLRKSLRGVPTISFHTGNKGGTIQLSTSEVS